MTYECFETKELLVVDLVSVERTKTKSFLRRGDSSCFEEEVFFKMLRI